MRQDSFGFFYWVDRIGDTFRWKGENVSTAEVAGVLAKAEENFADVNVYGVSVANHDGRAGMAAVSLQEGVSSDALDMALLFRALSRQLPSYAQPLFIRICHQLTYTTTFKHKKNDLRDQGFDPAAAGEGELFVRDPIAQAYTRLTPEVYSQIESGAFRL